MRVVGIVGSMRKEGNTHKLVGAVLSAAKECDPSLKTEAVYLADLEIGPCQACYDACAKEPYRCVVKDDFQRLLRKLEDADGLVLGAPLYFPVPSRVVALCERLACLAYFHEVRKHKGPHLLEDKPCAFVCATGGNDPMEVLQYLFGFALATRMTPLTLKCYPYYGAGGRGELEKDESKPLERAMEVGRLLAEAVKR